jgi:hypothetical protein
MGLYHDSGSIGRAGQPLGASRHRIGRR